MGSGPVRQAPDVERCGACSMLGCVEDGGGTRSTLPSRSTMGHALRRTCTSCDNGEGQIVETQMCSKCKTCTCLDCI